MRASILALCMVATPAMAADQFDLVCTGRHKTSPAGSWKPYEARYRVDLGAKAWCRGECTMVQTIAAENAGRIEFAVSNRQEPGAVEVMHYVDRSTGNWVYFISSRTGLYENAEGKCEVAPFTPLPQRKF